MFPFEDPEKELHERMLAVGNLINVIENMEGIEGSRNIAEDSCCDEDCCDCGGPVRISISKELDSILTDAPFKDAHSHAEPALNLPPLNRTS
jgi:hypothetical protein